MLRTRKRRVAHVTQTANSKKHNYLCKDKVLKQTLLKGNMKDDCRTVLVHHLLFHMFWFSKQNHYCPSSPLWLQKKWKALMLFPESYINSYILQSYNLFSYIIITFSIYLQHQNRPVRLNYCAGKTCLWHYIRK